MSLKKIAIIGAGFAGLSVAWHLLAKGGCEVAIYDAKGIGGGASGIATGLLHPYVGEQVRRSLEAKEGMEATQALIAVAQKKVEAPIVICQGILRYTHSEEQREKFLSHAKEFGDVERREENCFWISSGLTIDSPLYLEGLWRAISEKGGQLITSRVADLKALGSFDHIVIAAGSGIKHFPELKSLPLSLLKGQALICQAPPFVPLPKTTLLGKGHVALMRDPRLCTIGSTYEREDETEKVDAEKAKQLLFSHIESFFPAVSQLKIIDCKAALRVTKQGHYFPFFGKVKDNIWALTGLGSRGLLYHALLADRLSSLILSSA